MDRFSLLKVVAAVLMKDREDCYDNNRSVETDAHTPNVRSHAFSIDNTFWEADCVQTETQSSLADS